MKYIKNRVSLETSSPEAVRGRLYLEQLNAMKDRASAKLVELKKKRQQERQDEPKKEEDMMVLKEVVRAWMTSDQREEFYNMAKKEFKGWSYATVRNYLVIEMFLDSMGPRSEVLRKVTMEDVQRARETENGFTITVSRHKTGNTGAVYLTVSEPRLWWALMEFIRVVRPTVTKDNEGPVFVGVNRGQDNIQELSTLTTAVSILVKFAQTTLGKQEFHATPQSLRRLWGTIGGEHVRTHWV